MSEKPTPILLSIDDDGNLVIAQPRPGNTESVTLTRSQVNEMVDILLGPKKVRTVTLDLEKLTSEKEKQN